MPTTVCLQWSSGWRCSGEGQTRSLASGNLHVCGRRQSHTGICTINLSTENGIENVEESERYNGSDEEGLL